MPVGKTAPHRELTYFSTQPLVDGSIVRIPLRDKKGYGLVIRTTPLEEEKQNLKRGSFSLKKVSPQGAGLPLSRAFLRAAFETANYCGTSVGAVIDSLTPALVLADADTLPGARAMSQESHFEVLSYTAPKHDRISEYRRLARETLARGASLLILAPTIYEAEELAIEVGKGIEDRTYVIHGDQSKKVQKASWSGALENTHATLVVGTALALSLPLPFSTIVLERETSRGFERDERPFVSVAYAAERLAKALGSRIIYGSTVPSMKVAYRKERQEITDLAFSSGRLAGIQPTVIDRRRKHSEERGRQKFNPLSAEAYALIIASVREKVPVLILAARRGLSPLTICDDCGTVLTCSTCESALTLHSRDGRKFVCHFCGKEEDVALRCKKCNSWRLTTLGISVDRVAEALAEACPGVSSEVASRDTLKKKAPHSVVREFLDGTPSVMIATEVLIPYLPDESCRVIVASIDSLFSIPEYRIGERVLLLLADLRAIARDTFLLQTREPQAPAIKSAVDGMTLPFIRDELSLRIKYGYPPARDIVRITAVGRNAERDASAIAAALTDWNPTRIDARPKRPGERRIHILVRVPEGVWPDERLLRFLRSLPPSILIRINPPVLND